MKTHLLNSGPERIGVRCICLLASFLFLGLATASLAQPAQPAITSVRLEGTNVLVKAQVPAVIRKVT